MKLWRPRPIQPKSARGLGIPTLSGQLIGGER